MPSPFPGMNPYLEQVDVWHDFHERLIPAAAARPPLSGDDTTWALRLLQGDCPNRLHAYPGN